MGLKLVPIVKGKIIKSRNIGFEPLLCELLAHLLKSVCRVGFDKRIRKLTSTTESVVKRSLFADDVLVYDFDLHALLGADDRVCKVRFLHAAGKKDVNLMRLTVRLEWLRSRLPRESLLGLA